MNIIILHGDDYVKSQMRLKTFKDAAARRGWNFHMISDINSNILEVLSGQDLFVSERLVVVDELKLFNKKIFDWIKVNDHKYNTTLVIYSDKKIPATFIKSLPKKIKVEESKLPTKLWTMLDAFYPGNSKNFLKLLHEVAKSEPIELMFSLMSKQLKDIYWVMNSEMTFPQKGWRVSKLKAIGKKFSDRQLEELINVFAEIDIKSKTSDEKLIDLLDFIVISKLE